MLTIEAEQLPYLQLAYVLDCCHQEARLVHLLLSGHQVPKSLEPAATLALRAHDRWTEKNVLDGRGHRSALLYLMAETPYQKRGGLVTTKDKSQHMAWLCEHSCHSSMSQH